MLHKTVLVTGIGGNVGQGILRNIKALSKYNIRLIGCDISEFSAGNHLCDFVYKVPFAYSNDFISKVNEIVQREEVDLIIPSTDYEVYFLSLNRSKVLCNIAVSDVSAAEIYLDKYISFLHHKEFNIPFARSFLPSEYNGEFKNVIVKPRKGRGSRGLELNPSEFTQFKDEEYLVQELAYGIEVTTAFYVMKNKVLHGSITMSRTLDKGTTNFCQTTFLYDDKINKILLKIIEHTDIYGSANLQSIIDSDGNVIPFEINCRISGTNSVRSNFGFNDIDYTLCEYLFNTPLNKPDIISGSAVRITMDIIYPGSVSIEDIAQNKIKSYLF